LGMDDMKETRKTGYWELLGAGSTAHGDKLGKIVDVIGPTQPSSNSIAGPK